MVNFSLGQQSGFTKYPCFLCMGDSRNRAQHYTKKDWPVREELVPCRARNVINNPLVDREKIVFPPLHIKLGLIKQFTKALDKDGGCFTYLCHAFPGLTIEKLKASIFDGPQIRQLMGDPEFENSMNEVELQAWKTSREELSWQQQGRKLRRTCHQYAGCFQKPWMQHEHQNSLLILTYGSVSWKSWINVWWAGGEIPSGHKRDGDQVSGTLGCSHDGWLLLDSEERHSCCWTFEGFEETEIHALNFAQWRRNVQFTCTFLYQCLLFNLQKLKFVTFDYYILLENDFIFS